MIHAAERKGKDKHWATHPFMALAVKILERFSGKNNLKAFTWHMRLRHRCLWLCRQIMLEMKTELRITVPVRLFLQVLFPQELFGDPEQFELLAIILKPWL